MNNTEKEVWKPVIFEGVDYTGLYEISNFGNIFLHTPEGKKFLAKNKTRRRSVLLRKGDFKRAITVARVMASVFIRPLKSNEVADHVDNDPTNDHMDNIQILTIGKNLAKDHYARKRNNGLDLYITPVPEWQNSIFAYKTSIPYREKPTGKKGIIHLGCYKTKEQARTARDAGLKLKESKQGISIGEFKKLAIEPINQYRKSLGFPMVKIYLAYKNS